MTEVAAPPTPCIRRLLPPACIGAGVAVALGAYGRAHDPTGETPYQLFFTSTLNFKVWFATAAVLFAVVQLVTALRMYGKLGSGRQPSWLGDLHRLSGTLAFLVSLPVAYHCLWSLGFQSTDTRVLVHSLLGCAFYGAFVAKVLAVRTKGQLPWVLPVLGGLTFTVLVGVWLTSSLWFFTTVDFPGF